MRAGGQRATAVVAGILAAGAWLGCAPGAGPEPSAPVPDPFVDRAHDVGLDFAHANGMSGELYFVEIMGAGAALVDFDRDGDLDAYLVQGGPLPAPAGTAPPSDRLFRNLLVERGNLSFEDVTEAAGIDARGYGMGVATGDFDGDGWIDLYVTNFGPNQLWRNRGDGTFVEVGARAGVAEERWSSSATFFDYDRDGRLDLFVANYVDFSLERNQPCFAPTGARDYCGPLSYRPYPDTLYRNRGDGTFEDVSTAAKIVTSYGSGLGVVASDFDGDGREDLFVANDALPNQLWMNLGDGTFRDDSLIAGCAYNTLGEAEAGMGVDAADFDGDGDEDVFLTHLVEETNTLYVNQGKGYFDDLTIETKLAAPSRPFTGFGTAWIDYDNDGWLDLIVVNGAVKTIERLASEGDPFPLHESNHLFRNRGNGSFEPVESAALAVSEVSRGLAVGDVDNDGDEDALLTNNSGPARLLINETATANHWLGLRLTDERGETDVPGARAALVRDGSAVSWRTARSGAGYLSAHDPRVRFGLGSDASVPAVRVVWPDGATEQWSVEGIDRYVELRRGSGAAVR